MGGPVVLFLTVSLFEIYEPTPRWAEKKADPNNTTLIVVICSRWRTRVAQSDGSITRYCYFSLFFCCFSVAEHNWHCVCQKGQVLGLIVPCTSLCCCFLFGNKIDLVASRWTMLCQAETTVANAPRCLRRRRWSSCNAPFAAMIEVLLPCSCL